MGGAAQLLSLLQSWIRQSTALLLASENQELKRGSWELEADAVPLLVCGPPALVEVAKHCRHQLPFVMGPQADQVICHRVVCSK